MLIPRLLHMRRGKGDQPISLEHKENFKGRYCQRDGEYEIPSDSVMQLLPTSKQTPVKCEGHRLYCRLFPSLEHFLWCNG